MTDDPFGWREADPFGFFGALRTPWCRPVGAEGDGRARSLVAALGRPYPSEMVVRPGHALLVSVDPRVAKSGRLWVLVPPGERELARPFARFAGEAPNAFERARSVVVRALPYLVPSRDGAGEWHAWMVKVPTPFVEPALDGSSFGLAFALGLASELLGVRLPTDFVASAALTADGTLLPVSGVTDKVAVIARFAHGVTRVVVAAEQATEWRAAVEASPRPDIEVVPVRSVGEAVAVLALEEAFEASIEDSARDGAHARATANRLFELTLSNSASLLSWKGVARTAVVLQRALVLRGDTTHAERARVVERIALRHEGAPMPIAWPTPELEEGLRRERRLQLYAHVVQSVADSPDDPLPVARVARDRIATAASERGTEDAVLLGAVGRALAAGGAYDEAREALEAAWAEWDALGEMHQASMCTTELVRLAALAGEGAVARALEERLRPVLDDPRTGALSRSFLHAMAYRALVQVGRLEAAAGELAFVPLAHHEAPSHLVRATLRWRVRHEMLRGRAAEAERLLERLRTEGEDGRTLGAVEAGDEHAWLARLDAALVGQGDWDVRKRELLAAAEREHDTWGYEILRLARLGAGRGLQGRELAAMMVEEHRY